MLPAYIIEQLRQREDAREQERAQPQPRLELPVPERRHRPAPPDEVSDRGVLIIQVA